MSSLRRTAEKELQISNPDKVLYPAGKFTKADVARYYERIARFLLPHFRNRPVTLKRYPNGVFGEAFYEKDAPGFTPRWVKTFPVPRREGGPDINYILINDVRTLTWAANMAALELRLSNRRSSGRIFGIRRNYPARRIRRRHRDGVGHRHLRSGRGELLERLLVDLPRRQKIERRMDAPAHRERGGKNQVAAAQNEWRCRSHSCKRQ